MDEKEKKFKKISTYFRGKIDMIPDTTKTIMLDFP